MSAAGDVGEIFPLRPPLADFGQDDTWRGTTYSNFGQDDTRGLTATVTDKVFAPLVLSKVFVALIM